VAQIMNTRNRDLIVITCFVVLITGCSNAPSIKSATADKVIISSPPGQFTTAYELANKECLKNIKTAKYMPDSTVGLKEVAFHCVGPETEEEAGATDEMTTEVEAKPEETEELPAETEDALTETGPTQ